jgi:transcriptional regulator with XRE-family HTH domain
VVQLSRDLTLARVVRHARLAAEMTQEALAEASGLSRTYVSKVEGGEMSNPRLETLVALARALGITAGDLFRRLDADRASSASGA